MVLVTALVFVGLLFLLVMIHEWGHFIVAKKAGCTVEEFGFGFPPRLFGFKRGQTLYSINLLPLGGFVKIEGEDMQDVSASPTSFANKPALWRVAILAAGVTMNVILAMGLLSVQAGIGVPTLITDDNAAKLTGHRTYAVEVSTNSPAATAGLKALDRIVRINGLSDPTISDIQKMTSNSAGHEIAFEIERQGKHETITLTPRVNPPPGEGAIGISLAATGLEKIPWWQAPWVGIKRTIAMLIAIVSQFTTIIRDLVSQRTFNGTLTGPVGLVVYTKEATHLGISYVLEFGALISLNLALINILPLPALDGGRILFVLIEKIIGRRVPARTEQITHTVGFALLIFLMVLVTLQDIRHYF